MRRNEIYFMNNIRVLLAFLVVLFHTSSAYGGIGGWYYVEQSNDYVSLSLLTFINAICQSFFMGLFFFISGYFIPRSFDNKKNKIFLLDKIKRLIIPSLFYYFILNPICVNLINRTPYFSSVGFYNLWFPVALFYFITIYVIIRKVKVLRCPKVKLNSRIGILSFIIFVGIVNYIVRLFFSVDKMFFSDFTLGYFPQYIILFTLGIIAYRNDWLNNLNKKIVNMYFYLAIIAIIFLPIIFYFQSIFSIDLEWFYGGSHLESFIYSVWEPFTFTGIILKILYEFKRKFNCTNSILEIISRCSYSIYLIQSPIIILFQKVLRDFEINLFIKALIVTCLTFVASAIISNLVLKNNIIKEIL